VILIFKGLTARRIYKSFGVKGLIMRFRVYTYATVATKRVMQGKSKIGDVNLFLCYPLNNGLQEKEEI
jgi:hypothetical protein